MQFPGDFSGRNEVTAAAHQKKQLISGSHTLPATKIDWLVNRDNFVTRGNNFRSKIIQLAEYEVTSGSY